MSLTSLIRLTVSVSVLLALCLACGWGTEEGERALTGECPEGEVCSAGTPAGLTFVGQALFDDTTNDRLGPILVGGTFDLGFRGADGQPVPSFRYEIEGSEVLSDGPDDGVFGPDDESVRPHVDHYLTLSGVSEGSTYVRILDATSGELFDRILLDVYVIEDILVRNANDPERDTLLAGCDEMLGVRLIARNGTTEIRAIDQNITMRAEGEVSAEPAFWDCFWYSVPADLTEVDVEVEAGGRTFSRTLTIETLEDAGLTECPVITRD